MRLLCPERALGLSGPQRGRASKGAPLFLGGLCVFSAPSLFKQSNHQHQDSTMVRPAATPCHTTQPHSAFGSHTSLASSGLEGGSSGPSPKRADPTPTAFRPLNEPLPTQKHLCPGGRGRPSPSPLVIQPREKTAPQPTQPEQLGKGILSITTERPSPSSQIKRKLEQIKPS